MCADAAIKVPKLRTLPTTLCEAENLKKKNKLLSSLIQTSVVVAE